MKKKKLLFVTGVGVFVAGMLTLAACNRPNIVNPPEKDPPSDEELMYNGLFDIRNMNAYLTANIKYQNDHEFKISGDIYATLENLEVNL